MANLLAERLRKAARSGAARLALAAAVGLAAAFRIGAFQWPHYRLLQERGVGTDGWVTALDLGRSPRIYYSFRAGDRQYSGVWREAYKNPEPGELAAGDRVIVFYLPQDPDVSCLGDPKELLRDQNRIMSLFLVGFGSAILWLVGKELRRASE